MHNLPSSSRRLAATIVTLVAVGQWPVAFAPSLHAQTPAPPAASPEKKFDDQEIAFAIQSRYEFERAVPMHLVDVATRDGVVTLSGTVETLLAKERAAIIAQTVRGVRAVVNNVAVRPVTRSDEAIRKDVVAALGAEPATSAYQITVEVQDGVVMLSGPVQSFREKQLAALVARGVKGAREVKEKLNVQFAKNNDRPDSEIEADIRSGLTRDVWLDPSFVKVSVRDGTATLTGQVGSLAEKLRAEGLAWVSGVRAVDPNGLAVESWLADPMRRPMKPLPRSDTEIESAVRAAFKDDPRIIVPHPLVKVSGAVVTLSGTVKSVQSKLAAEQDARNTTGVRSVRNYLVVRPAKSVSDDQLVIDIREALLRDPFVDRFQITATAKNGFVTLKGVVDTDFERSTAQSLVARLHGVIGIDNRLKVEEPAVTYFRFPWAPDYIYDPHHRNLTETPLKSDSQIEQDIREQLWWSSWIDADKVTVTVQNGVATLKGTVDREAALKAATESAFEGGALAVRNELKVQ